MKKQLFLITIAFMCYGCANFLTTTATRGTSFGMTKEAVLRRLENKCKLLYQDDHVLVFDGIQEQLKQPAIKVFLFQNNHLVMVSDNTKVTTNDNPNNVTKEEAIEIANALLETETFKTKEKNIDVDENNTRWNMFFLSNEKAKEANPQIVNKLKDRMYWAINYTPKESNVLGGGAWVFVDKKSGEIILRFYEK